MPDDKLEKFKSVFANPVTFSVNQINKQKKGAARGSHPKAETSSDAQQADIKAVEASQAEENYDP